MEGLNKKFRPEAATTGEQTPTQLWKCPICSDYEKEVHQQVTNDDFESIRSHLAVHMRQKKTASVTCPVCPKEYRGDQISAFRAHLLKHSQLGEYPTDLQTINRDNDDSDDNEVFQEIVPLDDQDWNADVTDSEASYSGLSSQEEEEEDSEQVMDQDNNDGRVFAKIYTVDAENGATTEQLIELFDPFFDDGGVTDSELMMVCLVSGSL